MNAETPDGFAHTPWDGSHPLFRIGLSPLGEADWIEVDFRLGDYLAEKDRLLAARRDDVFRAGAGTADAQAETLELLLDHLPARYPEIYRRAGDRMNIAGSPPVPLADPATPPLETAARLVQEDLVVMMPSPQGWILAAGCVCFPSSWSLPEKIGRPLHRVHGPVPGFGTGTRNAAMIDRIFYNLQPETPVRRFNWSIYPDAELFHGDRAEERLSPADAEPQLRIEHQTLRRLPRTGAILFTIRIHLDPLALIARHRDRARLAAGFIDSLNRLDEEECRYKGLGTMRGELVARLEAIARAGASPAPAEPENTA